LTGRDHIIEFYKHSGMLNIEFKHKLCLTDCYFSHLKCTMGWTMWVVLDWLIGHI